MMKPNIVMILADDMGYGDISCLNKESKINTHHIDRMAEAGVAFTDAHAPSSVCTPSRYGILTGRYAWRGHLKRGVLMPFAGPLIEKDLVTLPGLLKDNGYETVCIGKWHLGMDYPFKDTQDTRDLQPSDLKRQIELDANIDYTKAIKNGPTAYGFDEFFGVDVPNFPPYCFIHNEHTVGIPNRLKPDDMFGHPGRMVEGWKFEEIMPTLTEKAEAYIEDHKNSKSPFFMYFSMTGPHTPIAPTEDFIGKSGAGIYGDYCLQMDDTVGRINEALKKAGLWDNTIVIFTSDNGSPGRDGDKEAPGTVFERYGHNPSGIFRGIKGDVYEGGHRVPFIVKGLEESPEGKWNHRLFGLQDIIATLIGHLSLAGKPDYSLDSLDLSMYLTEPEGDHVIRHELIHHGVDGLYAIRQDGWKLIFGTGSGGMTESPRMYKGLTIYDSEGQLYNMDRDPGESVNHYSNLPNQVIKLDYGYREALYQGLSIG